MGQGSLIDKRIGTILDKLEDLELARDTLVVFASGHGHSYGHHGLTAKGAFHYEDLIRVPLIVSPARQRYRPANRLAAVTRRFYAVVSPCSG